MCPLLHVVSLKLCLSSAEIQSSVASPAWALPCWTHPHVREIERRRWSVVQHRRQGWHHLGFQSHEALVGSDNQDHTDFSQNLQVFSVLVFLQGKCTCMYSTCSYYLTQPHTLMVVKYALHVKTWFTFHLLPACKIVPNLWIALLWSIRNAIEELSRFSELSKCTISNFVKHC